MNAETNLCVIKKKLKQIELWSFFEVRIKSITGFYCTFTAEGFLFLEGFFNPRMCINQYITRTLVFSTSQRALIVGFRILNYRNRQLDESFFAMCQSFLNCAVTIMSRRFPAFSKSKAESGQCSYTLTKH